MRFEFQLHRRYSGLNIMAIFKAGILAIALSFSLPLTSGVFRPNPFFSDQPVDTTSATAAVLVRFPGSVIYKTEAGFPDFMTKQSLPTRPYPPTTKSYSATSTQTVAAL